jgi:hypothetical protein
LDADEESVTRGGGPNLVERVLGKRVLGMRIFGMRILGMRVLGKGLDFRKL